MNWNNITIKMLQEITQLGEMDEVEKMAHQISIITGKPFEEIAGWTLKELQSVDLTFLNQMPSKRIKYRFKFKGRRFKLVRNAKEMSAHHFIELQQVQTEDVITKLNEIIAILTYRVNWWGKKIEDDYQWKVEHFKDLPITKIYAYTLFFSELYPRLLEATLTYLKEEEKEIKGMFSGGSQS